MNKHHNSRAPESVVRVIQTMSSEEIEQQYGIEIDKDGSVWDPLDRQSFPSVVSWAQYMDDMNNEAEAASKYGIGGRYAFDDEYY